MKKYLLLVFLFAFLNCLFSFLECFLDLVSVSPFKKTMGFFWKIVVVGREDVRSRDNEKAER